MENQEKKPLYFYGEETVTWKDQKINRRVAIAGVLDDDNVLRIGKAMCSEKDRFVKDKARKIASGRAIKHPESLLKITDNETVAKQFIAFCKTIVNPTRRK